MRPPGRVSGRHGIMHRRRVAAHSAVSNGHTPSRQGGSPFVPFADVRVGPISSTVAAAGAATVRDRLRRNHHDYSHPARARSRSARSRSSPAAATRPDRRRSPRSTSRHAAGHVIVGQTAQLTATRERREGQRAHRTHSRVDHVEPAIATVSSAGVVTGVSPGQRDDHARLSKEKPAPRRSPSWRLR